MLDRILCALYGGAVLALAPPLVATLVLGREFNLLSQDSWLAARWYYLYGWGAATAALAAARSPLAVWRCTLLALAVVHAAVPFAHARAAWQSGTALLTPLSAGMAIACIGIAAACLAVAARLRPAPLPKRTAPEQERGTPRRWMRAAHFALAAAAIVLAFHQAVGAQAASRTAGGAALGLLVAFLVTLPAASLAVWFPRLTALLHWGAGVIFAWVGWWILAAASAALGLVEVARWLASHTALARRSA
jgi:hypothetical protein